jgi:hypothetical protein
MTQSLQKFPQERKDLATMKPGSIMAFDAVNSTALVSYSPDRFNMATKIIEREIAKLFYALGQQVEIKRIEILTELLIESRKYETPETILLFLHKCQKGELGKFYGMPGIDELQEKFCDFLQYTIIPERERQRLKNKERQLTRPDTKEAERAKIREAVTWSINKK